MLFRSRSASVPYRSNIDAGVEVPIPMRPLILLMYRSELEVPTVKIPLPKGDEVPTPTAPANVEVALVEVAVKYDAMDTP